MGNIWDVNNILICAAASSVNSFSPSSSTSSTSYTTSSAASLAIEMSTYSPSVVTTANEIDTTLSESAWWRVGGWVKYRNHRRQVRGFFDECGWVWQLTDVDFFLQLCIWYIICSTVCSLYSGTTYLLNTLNIPLFFLIYFSNIKAVLFFFRLLHHVLCRIIGHWNVHIFPFCGHYCQWNRYRTFWTSLMKGWWMGKVSQPP